MIGRRLVRAWVICNNENMRNYYYLYVIDFVTQKWIQPPYMHKNGFLKLMETKEYLVKQYFRTLAFAANSWNITLVPLRHMVNASHAYTCDGRNMSESLAFSHTHITMSRCAPAYHVYICLLGHDCGALKVFIHSISRVLGI